MLAKIAQVFKRSQFVEFTGGRITELLSRLREGSQRLPDLSLDLFQAFSSSNQSLDHVRRSIEEMERHIEEVLDEFRKIEQMGTQSAGDTANKVQELTQFVGSLKEVNQHNREIERTAKSIEKITLQTNILAVNASVVAARSGEAGKSFAVIADSIRDLSDQSRIAATAIQNIVVDTATRFDTVAREAEDRTGQLRDIDKNMQQMTQMLNENISILREYSGLLHGITKSTQNISHKVNQGYRVVKDTSELSIRMGMDIFDMEVELGSFKSAEHQNTELSISSKHVFHFNFMNTLPALQLLQKRDGRTTAPFLFPSNPKKDINPEDVYQLLLHLHDQTAIQFNKPTYPSSKSGSIRPVDVLRLSVCLHEMLSQIAHSPVPEAALLIRYDRWLKEVKEVQPGHVYALTKYLSS